MVDIFFADILQEGFIPLRRETTAAMPVLWKRVV